MPSLIKNILVFHFVLLGWVWFRAQSIHDAFSIFKNIFSLKFSSRGFIGIDFTEILFAFFVSSIILFIEFRNLKPENIYTAKARWSYCILLVACIYLFGIFHNKQFLYFQF